ncbi:MAG: hypothetical protein WCI74_12935 [Actinomycetes bacterium]
MPATDRSGRWFLLALLGVPLLLLATAVAFGTWRDSWAWLNGAPYPPVFSDLQQVTYTADCLRADPTWTLASATCDPFGRAFNYPSVWVQAFAALGLGADATRAVGTTFALLLVVALLVVVFWFRAGLTDAFGLVTVALLMVSPPVWLAIHRGSTDSLIIALLVLSVGLSRLRQRIPSVVAIVLTVALKLFAIGSFASVVADPTRRRINVVVGVLGVVGVAWILHGELALISSRTPRTDNMSFGVSVLPISFQTSLGSLAGNGKVLGGLAAVSFLMSCAAVWLVNRLTALRGFTNRLRDWLVQDRLNWLVLLTFGGAFIVAYGVGSSYDYRLTLVIPFALVFLSATGTARQAGRTFGLVLLLLVLASGHIRTPGHLDDWVWLLMVPYLLLLMAGVIMRLRGWSGRFWELLQ